MNKTLLLTKSFNRCNQSDFETVLEDELIQNVRHLPLEKFCNSGGWPDEETLELSIRKVQQKDKRIWIGVHCSFKEAIQTGCSECPITELAMGDFDVVLDVENSMAYIDDSEEHG